MITHSGIRFSDNDMSDEFFTEWEFQGMLPFPMHGLCCCVTKNEEILVIGSHNSNQCFKIDTKSNKIEKLPSMPLQDNVRFHSIADFIHPKTLKQYIITLGVELNDHFLILNKPYKTEQYNWIDKFNDLKLGHGIAPKLCVEGNCIITHFHSPFASFHTTKLKKKKKIVPTPWKVQLLNEYVICLGKQEKLFIPKDVAMEVTSFVIHCK